MANQVPTFFGATDIAVLPFRSVLNSGSAILTASMATFAVVPDIPTLYSNLDHRALTIYETANDNALLDAIVNTVNRPREELRQHGLNAREFARSKLCWSKIGKSTLDMYEKTLNN